MMGYTLFSPRHLQLTIRTVTGPMIFENVHGPTNDAAEGDKERFFNGLEESLEFGTAAWPRVVIGDFNVRWHVSLKGEETWLGPYTGGKGSREAEKEMKKDGGNRRRFRR